MSPEQALDQPLIPFRHLCCGLSRTWLITGQLVFTGSTVIETILQHKDGNPFLRPNAPNWRSPMHWMS